MCLSREGLVRLIRDIYNQMYFLQELGILLGGCLTCEELVGVTNRRKDVACWEVFFY